MSKLWASTAMTPYGRPFGSVTVIAANRGDALAKARTNLLEAESRTAYVPARKYVANLLEHLESTLEEVEDGVLVEWEPDGQLVRFPRVG